MIRNLKALVAAAMALAAFGAIGVDGASAAGEEFHCSVEPCTYRMSQDGTGKTGHQVIIVENQEGTKSGAFTCETISGRATSATKTTQEVKITNIAYGGCSFNGSGEVIIDMNGCTRTFTAQRRILGIQIWHEECVVGKKVEITFRDPTTHALKCTFDIPGQSPEGANSHNIGEEAKTTTEITIEVNAAGIMAEATGTSDAECGGLPRNAALKAHYSTGNVLLTGETDPGEVMANAWWK